MKTYTLRFKVNIYDNDKIIKIERFKTRDDVAEYLEKEGNPPLKYETKKKDYYTLES